MKLVKMYVFRKNVLTIIVNIMVNFVQKEKMHKNVWWDCI